MRQLARIVALAWLTGASASASPQWLDELAPSQGRLGVQLQSMTPELREYLHAPADRGVLIVRVNESSAAAKAGLRVGDVIVGVGGKPISSTHEIVQEVMRAEQDATLELEVVRDGKTRTLEPRLAGEPSSFAKPLMMFERAVPELRAEFEKRIDELERRLEELEQKLEATPPAKPERDT